MIDQIELDRLKRALAQLGSDEYFELTGAEEQTNFDLDLLRDLVKLASNDAVDLERLYRDAYDEGWDDCHASAEIVTGRRNSLLAWKDYQKRNRQ